MERVFHHHRHTKLVSQQSWSETCWSRLRKKSVIKTLMAICSCLVKPHPQIHTHTWTHTHSHRHWPVLTRWPLGGIPFVPSHITQTLPLPSVHLVLERGQMTNWRNWHHVAQTRTHTFSHMHSHTHSNNTALADDWHQAWCCHPVSCPRGRVLSAAN